MGLFDGMKKRAASKFLVKDFEKTLTVVRCMPIEEQRIAAQFCGAFIVETLGEMGEEGGAQRVRILEEMITHAMGLRHEALENGAQDRANLQWALASLAESLVASAHPSVPSETFSEISRDLTAWAGGLVGQKNYEEFGFDRITELRYKTNRPATRRIDESTSTTGDGHVNRFCPFCGGQISATWRFCSHCAHELNLSS